MAKRAKYVYADNDAIAHEAPEYSFGQLSEAGQAYVLECDPEFKKRFKGHNEGGN